LIDFSAPAAQKSTNNNSTEVVMMKGYWKAVAVCVVGLLLALPPRGVFADPTPASSESLSLNFGHLHVEYDITNPVVQPGGGFKTTLHIHAQDNTQTPTSTADLIAAGQASDANTLLGGFLPAAIIVLKEIAAGTPFQQAALDAQAKTGVTVTFLNDPTAVEYAVMLALIIVVCITDITMVQPGFSDQACAIRSHLEAGLAAAGVANPPDPCTPIIP
jgi:Flp pilus assembly pilin Flp